jgi:hypothetical protein
MTFTQNPSKKMPESAITGGGHKDTRTTPRSDIRFLPRKKVKKMFAINRKKSIEEKRSEFYTKFLEKTDVIEHALTIINHDKVFHLINVLYDNLTEPISSNYNIFKLLVKQEQM